MEIAVREGSSASFRSERRVAARDRRVACATRCLRALDISALVAAITLLTLAQPVLPQPLNLRLAAPIKTWDEAIPLGNGAMGVLFWGEGNVLRLSLDRGDLWDERLSPAFLQVRDRFH